MVGWVSPLPRVLAVLWSLTRRVFSLQQCPLGVFLTLCHCSIPDATGVVKSPSTVEPISLSFARSYFNTACTPHPQFQFRNSLLVVGTQAIYYTILTLTGSVPPDSLQVNALSRPIRRPKRWRIRPRVRSSESCGADRLRRSCLSHPVTRLQSHVSHCSWRKGRSNS